MVFSRSDFPRRARSVQSALVAGAVCSLAACANIVGIHDLDDEYGDDGGANATAEQDAAADAADAGTRDAQPAPADSAPAVVDAGRDAGSEAGVATCVDCMNAGGTCMSMGGVSFAYCQFNCDGNVATMHCAKVACPSGVPCVVSCANGTCDGGVDCSEASYCNVTCKMNSCEGPTTIVAPTSASLPMSTLSCMAASCNGAVDCSGSSAKVTCDPTSCKGSVSRNLGCQ